MVLSAKFLSRAEAAEVLAAHGYPWRSPKTLATMAWSGDGPPFRRAGNRVLYAEDRLLSWAASKLSEETTCNTTRAGATE